MTARQIEKRLVAAGIPTHEMEISRDQIEIRAGYKESNGHGTCSERAIKAISKKVRAIFPWGGFYTGYGALVLQANYKDSGDWNNPSSRCHY